MTKSWTRIAVLGLVGVGIGACNNGGVALDPHIDAAVPEVIQRDTERDLSTVVVNLDVAAADDAAPTSCTQIDGSTVCVVAVCGNGIMEGAEECDDGNTQPAEGCTSECKLETDWACPTPGSPCISTVVCGDGRVSGNEVCDDHNTVGDDGCAASCKAIDPGWNCPAPGARCQPKCGDGLLVGSEECDDGNTAAEDGCGATCKVEPGSACPTAGQPCHATVCGDGKQEGSESCDDGNLLPGDGCTTDCLSEPKCEGSDGCTSPCGDALKLPTEECDDGNQKSGDGCSADCKLEKGWDCKDVEEITTKIPIYYRDMIPQLYYPTARTAEPVPLTDPPPHPNFEVERPSGRVVKGIVQDALGPERVPLYNDAVDPAEAKTTNAEDFASWYRDSKYSKVVIDTLTFTAQPDGTFVYDNSGTWNRTTETWTTPAFFPLDDRGWATPPDGPEIPYLGTATNTDGKQHNFGFTSEVRYWFEYQGGENLAFTGDDDVWVFVNGKLAVDLGGVHEAASASIVLDDAAATTYNLAIGKIYEIVVFQAERRTTQSSYKLTIGKFTRTHTVCTPACGDGVINGTETCDEGPLNSDTTYGGCTTKCVYGAYCGDGNVDVAGGEACDDGKNTAAYGQATGCLPSCQLPHYCGDSHVDSLFGEECDNGPRNGQSLCTVTCKAIVP